VNEVLNYAQARDRGRAVRAPGRPRLRRRHEAEGLILPQARARKLALSVADCPGALAVRADPEKLRQVLVNLLSNAIKFTNARDGLPGRVEVTCEPGPDGRVRVSVRDTGIGIAADKLEAIFEPFVQVRADLTRTAEGRGWGSPSAGTWRAAWAAT
jgi:signal transduction histidine kinase